MRSTFGSSRALTVLITSAALLLARQPADGRDAPKAPPFPHQDPERWVGSPVRLEDLRGRVVLLDVWTFGWINCVRTVPWVRDALARLAPRGLVAVGIHTPEFEHERRREAVIARVREHRLAFPHLLDNDYAYWKALGNEYWPTLYLIDRCGRVRERAIGEAHRGEASGRRLDAALEALLAEDVRDCS